jgi:hypothetical protein
MQSSVIKVTTPGHRYELPNFEHADQPCANPTHAGELRTVNDGTTNEDVLAVLIDRLKFLNAKFPCKENSVAITHIETALLWLEKRTRDRIARGVEGQNLE